MPTDARYVVKYRGFLQYIERSFSTLEGAEQWARMVGVYKIATIERLP